MTAKKLKQYRALCREIKDLERRIENKRTSETVSDVVRGSENCYPFIGRKFTISGIEQQASRLELEALKQRCCRERDEIQAYIDSIEDSMTRQIFRYKHLDGLSWRAVALRVGGGITESGVRMTHDRHLRKN